MITSLLTLLTADYGDGVTEEVGDQSKEIFSRKIGLSFENHPIDFN